MKLCLLKQLVITMIIPDNDVLASETTLNSNDVRLTLTVSDNHTENHAEFVVFTFLEYQASIALYPGNETRLLIT